jgi:hypothetical protein
VMWRGGGGGFETGRVRCGWGGGVRWTGQRRYVAVVGAGCVHAGGMHDGRWALCALLGGTRWMVWLLGWPGHASTVTARAGFTGLHVRRGWAAWTAWAAWGRSVVGHCLAELWTTQRSRYLSPVQYSECSRTAAPHRRGEAASQNTRTPRRPPKQNSLSKTLGGGRQPTSLSTTPAEQK